MRLVTVRTGAGSTAAADSGDGWRRLDSPDLSALLSSGGAPTTAASDWYIVGVMMSAFGLFWFGEGIGLRWPFEDAAIIGLMAVVFAANVLTIKLTKRAALRVVDHVHQVRRALVDRRLEPAFGRARAFQHRLVIAGQKPLRFTETRDVHRPKIVLEEAARSFLVAWPRRSRAPADLPERVVDRPVVVGALGVAKGLAAHPERSERREMIVGGPAVDITPFDRLELAVRELQRFFGRCGVGRQT